MSVCSSSSSSVPAPAGARVLPDLCAVPALPSLRARLESAVLGAVCPGSGSGVLEFVAAEDLVPGDVLLAPARLAFGCGAALRGEADSGSAWLLLEVREELAPPAAFPLALRSVSARALFAFSFVESAPGLGLLGGLQALPVNFGRGCSSAPVALRLGAVCAVLGRPALRALDSQLAALGEVARVRGSGSLLLGAAAPVEAL